ncbi:hypothetical protein KSP40_PGU013156 [Platanthera guangdongensis]|uniref:Uncharacterized protein n=1 Tax=Platanthera guangdongensis TaxID=2320717 RepID=A0ABR2N3Q6_9ASPA
MGIIMNQYKDALEAINEVIDRDSKDDRAYHRKGAILSKLSPYKEALEAYLDPAGLPLPFFSTSFNFPKPAGTPLSSIQSLADVSADFMVTSIITKSSQLEVSTKEFSGNREGNQCETSLEDFVTRKSCDTKYSRNQNNNRKSSQQIQHGCNFATHAKRH